MGRRTGRLSRAGLAILVVAGVLAATVTDVHAHQRARHEQQVLAATRRVVWEKQSDVDLTTNVTKRDSGIRNSLEETAGTLLGQLASDQTALATTTTVAATQGTAIGTLQTCLEGVNGALQQITAHNETQATADISSASGACLTLEGGANSGLVYPFDFPDPFVLRVGGLYLAYATNSVEGNIQIIESTDLVHWSAVGNALPHLPSWAEPGGTWAPSVLQVGGTFLLYYVAMLAGRSDEECISVATATSAEGPFIDNSNAPLVCQTDLNGSIDPSPFVDASGTPYLQWKSNGGAGHPATIWSQQLTASGTGFATGTPAELLTADQPWEAGVIEAPDLVFSAGRYFLFYSGNNWNGANYAVGVATCRGPEGPCTDLTSQPILSSGPGMAGPGGESVFFDASGTPWIAFHAWVPGAVGYPNSRALYLRPLSLSGPVPAVEPAT
jgi:beta-xylosidase